MELTGRKRCEVWCLEVGGDSRCDLGEYLARQIEKMGAGGDFLLTGRPIVRPGRVARCELSWLLLSYHSVRNVHEGRRKDIDVSISHLTFRRHNVLRIRRVLSSGPDSTPV